MPTLAEFLALVAGRAPLLIEVKDQDGALGPDVGALEARVAALLAGYAGAGGADVVQPAFGRGASPTLAPDRAARPDHLRLRRPPTGRCPTTAAPSSPRSPTPSGPAAAFVSHDRKDLANPALARLKAEGLPILTWTIRSPAEEAAARRVADNITFEGYRAALTPVDALRDRPCHSRREHRHGRRRRASRSRVLGGLDEIAAAEWDACAGRRRRDARRSIPSPPTASCARSRPPARSAAAAAGRRATSSRAPTARRSR